ncbi:uncharacterized protein LOC127123115 [Lathyrus oleraceus]|uniref:uncharacterized protein LOC127123115 n=1 Tax=Pisum sativum TaxID=3888 RepID=UPI0021D28DED|nr:uncharacterized protein LOC127123115 [Pisum sativum]
MRIVELQSSLEAQELRLIEKNSELEVEQQTLKVASGKKYQKQSWSEARKRSDAVQKSETFTYGWQKSDQKGKEKYDKKKRCESESEADSESDSKGESGSEGESDSKGESNFDPDSDGDSDSGGDPYSGNIPDSEGGHASEGGTFGIPSFDTISVPEGDSEQVHRPQRIRKTPRRFAEFDIL